MICRFGRTGWLHGYDTSPRPAFVKLKDALETTLGTLPAKRDYAVASNGIVGQVAKRAERAAHA